MIPSVLRIVGSLTWTSDVRDPSSEAAEDTQMNRARAVTVRLATLGTALAVLRAGAWAAPADNRPNVVFILADNVGYGDMG